MKRRKNMLKDRPGVLWLVGLGVLGLAVAFVITSAISGAEKATIVYVAAQSIPDDTVITAQDIGTTKISASVVPQNAVQNLQSIIGKYADSTIAQGEPILQSDVAPAITVRQLVRTYGMNFVGATVELDPSDLPIADVNPGDLVDLIGVYGNQSQNIYTQWIAQGVPVIAVDTANTKIVLAIPQIDALTLVRDLTTGKVRIMLDPQPFNGAKMFQTQSSATDTLPKNIKAAKGKATIHATSTNRSIGLANTVLPPGKNALINAKKTKTSETSHAPSSK